MRTIAIAAAVVAGLPVTSASAQVVRHERAPYGLALNSVRVLPGATTMYLSGQVASPVDHNAYARGEITAQNVTQANLGDTKTQTISALSKVKALLAAHGMVMSDVIKMTIFIKADPKLGGKMDWEGMQQAFQMFFNTKENPDTVARTIVQVAGLIRPAFLVSIDAIAAK